MEELRVGCAARTLSGRAVMAVADDGIDDETSLGADVGPRH